jgi:nicotinamide-nucleotide amidase
MTARTILELAHTQGITIATAESCTGGMVSAALTDIAGSSAIFDRGFVTYTNAAKMELLDVQANSLDQHGAVSEQVAQEMALGALAHSNASLSVAITGIAGPSGSDFKPEGRVCFAVAQNGNIVTTQTIEFGALGRDRVRQAARDHALSLLRARLEHTQVAQ